MTGLYDKFHVLRTDGQSAPGKKHDGCRYFVIDLDHDTRAPSALRAYARDCATEEQELANDLRGAADGLEAGRTLGELSRELKSVEWKLGNAMLTPVEHCLVAELEIKARALREEMARLSAEQQRETPCQGVELTGSQSLPRRVTKGGVDR